MDDGEAGGVPKYAINQVLLLFPTITRQEEYGMGKTVGGKQWKHKNN